MDGKVSCAGYAAPKMPDLEEGQMVLESTQQLLGLLPILYQKSLARLVEIVEHVEDAIGLQRLEVPVIEEIESEDGRQA